jgi:hypothetical protein
MRAKTAVKTMAIHGLRIIALGALLLPAAGCGSSHDCDRLPVFPTKGTVKLEGTSPKGALIVFHPKAGKLSASDGNTIRPHGTVRSDGTFELTSYETNDGAPAGEYLVTLELRKVVKYPNGNAGPGPNLVPKKYTKSDATPLLVQIQPGPNELPPIVLK